MITDYSEVMSHIHKDLNELQHLLDTKQLIEADKKIDEIAIDLKAVRDWIYSEVSK